MTEAEAVGRRTFRQEAPQLMRVLSSREWQIDMAVWHDKDWETIPDDVVACLLNLRGTLAALPEDRVRRFEVRCERR